MRLANVAADGATTRLIAAAQATLMTEGLPRESAKTLVASAKGARLYMEARELGLAKQQIDHIDKLMGTCEDQLLVKAYTRLTGDVRKALRWEEVHG